MSVNSTICGKKVCVTHFFRKKGARNNQMSFFGVFVDSGLETSYNLDRRNNGVKHLNRNIRTEGVIEIYV